MEPQSLYEHVAVIDRLLDEAEPDPAPDMGTPDLAGGAVLVNCLADHLGAVAAASGARS